MMMPSTMTLQKDYVVIDFLYTDEKTQTLFEQDLKDHLDRIIDALSTYYREVVGVWDNHNHNSNKSLFKIMAQHFLNSFIIDNIFYDLKLVCDDTNNPPNVIDSDNMIADAFLKPAQGMGFGQLRFAIDTTHPKYLEHRQAKRS